MPRQTELERRIAAIDQLVRSLENASDPATRAAAQELAGTLMELHAAALERVLAIIGRQGPAASAIVEQLAGDEVVSGVLLLHDLHPVDLPTRVRGALEKTRPYLQSHGGNVELVGIDEAGVVRLRMVGSCHGCPSSAMTLKLAIEQAIQEAAPDVTAIVVDGEPNGGPGTPAPRELVALEPMHHAPAETSGDVWHDVPLLDDLRPGEARALAIAGREVLFLALEGRHYAYGARCPACNAELAGAELAGHTLACPACGRGYDVIQAGRAIDRGDLHLDPFPILTRHGRVQMAVPPPMVTASP